VSAAAIAAAGCSTAEGALTFIVVEVNEMIW
jgi:hypothetical protein